ncbi:putative integrator complex subunit 3 [Dioscorea sansibarensis]
MELPQLLQCKPYECENPFGISLREAFVLLQSQLKPPFSLKIPSPSEYSQLNLAIVYGILTQPQLAKTHLTHLHAIVTDGYCFLTSTLTELVNDSFPRLLGTPRTQLLWLTSKLVDVSAVKIENLLVLLLRWIIGGDFSEPNLWLCAELLRMFLDKWEWLSNEPLVLTSALFVYLRLLADHYRLAGGVKLEALKRMEIDFCVRVLRECFGLCLKIGRDLVRLLQDVVYIPEFKELWNYLLFNPDVFRISCFSDISQLYCVRTPKHYFLLRINPEMEAELRFLLSFVKWGSQKRYQIWFAKKHLSLPGSETVMVDIVRFICCAHHPSNEIIQSSVIPRWAIIGWLLKCCRRNYFQANLKLALFYDWLFYDEKHDNIMSIEPAILLILNSVPKYVDITHTLLEFLFLLVDNYDVNRREMIARCVSTSFGILLKKGVVQSLEPLTSCSVFAPSIQQRLAVFIGSKSTLNL